MRHVVNPLPRFVEAFWRKYFPDVGSMDYGRAYGSAGGGEWTNNRFMSASGVLSAEVVPPPAAAQ